MSVDRDTSKDAFGIQDGSIARPGTRGPKLTPEQKALADKNREAYAEERRLREQHHAHGDTSGGTTDPGPNYYDEDDVYREPREAPLPEGTDHVEEEPREESQL